VESSCPESRSCAVQLFFEHVHNLWERRVRDFQNDHAQSCAVLNEGARLRARNNLVLRQSSKQTRFQAPLRCPGMAVNRRDTVRRHSCGVLRFLVSWLATHFLCSLPPCCKPVRLAKRAIYYVARRVSAVSSPKSCPRYSHDLPTALPETLLHRYPIACGRPNPNLDPARSSADLLSAHADHRQIFHAVIDIRINTFYLSGPESGRLRVRASERVKFRTNWAVPPHIKNVVVPTYVTFGPSAPI